MEYNQVQGIPALVYAHLDQTQTRNHLIQVLTQSQLLLKLIRVPPHNDIDLRKRNPIGYNYSINNNFLFIFIIISTSTFQLKTLSHSIHYHYIPLHTNKPTYMSLKTTLESSDKVKYDLFLKGLNETTVRTISHEQNEPEWMLDLRLKSLEQFKKMPMPTR